MLLAQQTGAVLTVLALFALVFWGLRRMGAGSLCGPSRWPGSGAKPVPLRVMAQLALTPQHRLFQIETAQGECYMLATHPAGVTVVGSGKAGQARPAPAVGSSS